MNSSSTVAVVGLCGNERTTTRGLGRARSHASSRLANEVLLVGSHPDLEDACAPRASARGCGSGSSERGRAPRRLPRVAPTSGGRSPPWRPSSPRPPSPGRAPRRSGGRRGRRTRRAASGCPWIAEYLWLRGFSAASASFATATSGEGISGLPNPRSITSSPARRSSRVRSRMTANTYGGRSSMRLNSIGVSGGCAPDEVGQLGHDPWIDRVRDGRLAPENVGARFLEQASRGRTESLGDDGVVAAVSDRDRISSSPSRSSAKSGTCGTKPESAISAAGRGRPLPRPSAYDITEPCENPPRTTRSIGTASPSRNAPSWAKLAWNVSGIGRRDARRGGTSARRPAGASAALAA